MHIYHLYTKCVVLPTEQDFYKFFYSLTLDSPEGTSWPFAISSSFMSLTEQCFFSLSLIPHISWLWFCLHMQTWCALPKPVYQGQRSLNMTLCIKKKTKVPSIAPQASSSPHLPLSSASLMLHPPHPLYASCGNKPNFSRKLWRIFRAQKGRRKRSENIIINFLNEAQWDRAQQQRWEPNKLESDTFIH